MPEPTTIDERTDTKAGYSSFCRRAEHVTCKTVQARCTCSCHGHRGQQPPTTKGNPVTITQPIPLRTPPDETAPASPNGALACPDCDKTFERPQGLGSHRSRAHGYRTNGTPKPPRPKIDTAPVHNTPDDETDPWLLVVAHATDDTMRASSIVLSTEHDAREVAQLLSTLGQRSFVFRLADAR